MRFAQACSRFQMSIRLLPGNNIGLMHDERRLVDERHTDRVRYAPITTEVIAQFTSTRLDVSSLPAISLTCNHIEQHHDFYRKSHRMRDEQKWLPLTP
jgi:hypothetical protein